MTGRRTLGRWSGLLAMAGGLALLMGANDDNGCTPTPDPGESQCEAPVDCEGLAHPACDGAWSCDSGTCDWQCDVVDPAGCYGDQDCEGGLVCNAAEVCLSPPGCTGDAPCPAVCYGHCVEPDNRPDDLCYSDRDCRDGFMCDFEVCHTPSGSDDRPDAAAIACMGACVPKQDPPTGCMSDEECGAGERCNTWDHCDPHPDCAYDAGGGGPDGAPEADPDFAPTCPAVCYGRCEDAPVACADSDDCREGEICGCAPWDGAANGLIACEPQCLPDPTACTSDRDCGYGEACDDGQCVPRSYGECYGEDDCGNGQHCERECGADPVPCECGGDGGGDGDCACPGGAPAPCPGRCVDNPPDAWCDSDSDCREDHFCGCAAWDADGAAEPDPSGDIACRQRCLPREEPPPACESDRDCGFGQACECAAWDANGDGQGDRLWCEPQCVDKPFECGSNDDCASGVCNIVACSGSADPAERPCRDEDGDGMCDDGDPPPPPMDCWGYCGEEPWQCRSDDECGDHSACIDGVCHPRPPEGCESDRDCRDGMRCEQRMCPGAPCTFDEETGETWCPPCPGECVPDRPQDCSNGAACPADQYCAVDCATACPDCAPDGSSCPPCETHCFGECRDREYPQECNTVNDCDDGERCECTQNPACPECDDCFFQCVPDQDPGECRTNRDCGAGQVCNTLCPPCAFCPDGEECPNCECFNVCQDEPEPPPYVPCDAAGECAAGYQCECLPDPNCPACAVCWMGCVEDPNARHCSSDRECPDDWSCEMGTCPMFLPCSEGDCPGCDGVCVPPDTEPTECMRTGCSGQVCADEPVDTTCDWQPHYICYELARCGENAAGSCGWEATDAFISCMQQHFGGRFGE